MVYIKPVLASAVAFTLVSSVAALPAQRLVARQDAPPSDDTSNPPQESYPSKRDGPMVVQAKSLQAAKRAYVGGGHAQGYRKLKQAPLMKAAKLFRSKRDIVEARDEHVHEHIHIDDHHHDHDDHHHHHDDHYDHHHSEHYNYHHGLTDHDDDDHHHHHHERDLVNVAALNNNSPSNNKVNVKKINKIHKSSKKIGKINKCKGSHFHCNQHKRDENASDAEGDDELDNTRLVRRRKNYNNGGNRHNSNNGYHNNKNNSWKNKQNGDDKTIKAQTELSTGGFKRTGVLPGEMKPGLSARHHDHHDEHEWEHEHEHYDHYHNNDEHVHEHIHSHEHKRNLSARRHDDLDEHVHVHEDEHYHHHDYDHHHHSKRDHHHHDEDAWLDDMTYTREWRDDHAHIHIHEHDHGHYHGHHHHHHDKRQATEKGIPGFVEVANTLAGTSLAKSVAGLVFSKGPDPNASGFLLGTSDTQSTQFYLVPNQDSSIETTQSANATMGSPEDAAQMYQLRIPVLDSKTFESNDYCATFDILPPSPMTMAPCKYMEGFSQLFRYNATTGELTPVYPPTDSQPKPMNAAVRYSEPQVMAAKFPVSDNQVPAGQDVLSAATGMPSASSSSTTSSDTAASTPDASASSSASDAETTDTSSSSATPAAPQSTSSATPEDGAAPADAPKVSLFFIPASTYASEKDSSSAGPAPSSTTAAPTAPLTSDAPLFSVAPAQAKIVAPSDGDQDLSGVSDDSGVVTTTVVVTSTMDADTAQATPSSSSSSELSSTDAPSTESQA
ncbi:hypothetical protein P389DRAFT_102435 [Cystobasidium minutum MCA 4210]|uniref:uncharacterized protein n=1 Tax=Cystobasidium minutum MCA 4210 TaxID=1397322 RepID=UPI0034CFC659|eukprot:jgi/Rhomi1/102435/CE102434_322